MPITNPPSSGGGSSTIPVGNTLFVDAVNGNDGTGTRGRQDKPFLTLTAAKTAASSGDTIIVGPGNYVVSESPSKNGVNWYFPAGATVDFPEMNTGDSMWGDLDGSSPMSFRVDGQGVFTGSSLLNTLYSAPFAALVRSENEGSNISVRAHRISVDTSLLADSLIIGVLSVNGKLSVDADIIEMTCADGNGSSAVWWVNGEMHVSARRINANGQGTQVIYCAQTGTANGDFFGEFDTVETTSAHSTAIYFLAADPTAAAWINAKTVKASGSLSYSVNVSGSRAYLSAHKLFGGIQIYGGLAYIRAFKIARINDDSYLFRQQGGDARISIEHWDNNGKGDTGSPLFDISVGKVIFDGGSFVGGAATQGFLVGAPTILNGFTIDTSANSSTSPVTASSDGLILDGVKLISEPTQDSIAAATAQNVKVYGTSVANTAKNANVTIQVGTLTVDANVT